MENYDVGKIANLAEVHAKTHTFPEYVRRAMKEYGIKKDNPRWSEIFGEVKAELNERADVKKELEKMKERDALRDAAAHERQQPPNTYRNL